MKKASFTRLSKLFEIDVVEWAHNALLSDKNLQALIKNLKSFIIPVFPWLAPPSLVHDEHFVLKDLSFYKVARLEDYEARQALLKEQEKKCLKRTLRQDLIASYSTSNSTICHSAQKKKSMACPILNARTPPTATPSSSSSSSPSYSLSSSSSSDKVEAWVNQLVPHIICKKEKEREMASNLRVGFHERQHKHLFESIAIDLSPSKKAHPTPSLDSLSKPTQLTPTVDITSSLDEKPSSISDISYHEMRNPFVSQGTSVRFHSSVWTLLLFPQRQLMSPTRRKCPSF